MSDPRRKQTVSGETETAPKSGVLRLDCPCAMCAHVAAGCCLLLLCRLPSRFKSRASVPPCPRTRSAATWKPCAAAFWGQPAARDRRPDRGSEREAHAGGLGFCDSRARASTCPPPSCRSFGPSLHSASCRHPLLLVCSTLLAQTPSPADAQSLRWKSVPPLSSATSAAADRAIALRTPNCSSPPLRFAYVAATASCLPAFALLEHRCADVR